LGRSIAKEETDRWLDDLGFPIRDEVHFDDEIGPWMEAPRERVGEKRDHLSRRPAKKVTIGINGRREEKPLVSRSGVGFIEAA